MRFERQELSVVSEYVMCIKFKRQLNIMILFYHIKNEHCFKQMTIIIQIAHLLQKFQYKVMIYMQQPSVQTFKQNYNITFPSIYYSNPHRIMKENIKQFKYLFTAELTHLVIKTGITCQVSATWKRSQEAAKTDPVNFTNGQANFNQTLTLPVKMYFNTSNQLFEQKKSQFMFTLHSDKGDKSAGTVKIDLSKLLNDKLEECQQLYALEKCPDPKATIKIKLQAELLGEQDAEKDRMSDNQSLNASTTSFKIEELPQQSVYAGGQYQPKLKTQQNIISERTTLPQLRQKQYQDKIKELMNQNSRLTMQNRKMRETINIFEKQSVSYHVTERKLSQDIQLARHKSESAYRNMLESLQSLV